MVRVVKWLGLAIALLVLLLAVTLVFMDWNRLKGVVTDQLSEQLGRTVTIAGDVEVDLSLKPRLSANDIRLANASWAEAPYMLTVSKLALTVDLLELLSGQLVIPDLQVIDPSIVLAISEQGEENWTFDTDTPSTSDDATSESSSLTTPVIKHVTVKDARFTYHNRAAEPPISAVISDLQLEGGFDQALRARGSGELQGQPAQFSLNGETLADWYDAKQAYPVDVHVMAGDTEMTLQGTIPEPGLRRGVDKVSFLFSITSPDSVLVGEILGINAANLPGYRLKVGVARQENAWRLNDLQAHVGETDIAGELTIKVTGQQPSLEAKLTSETFDVAQLESIASIIQASIGNSDIDSVDVIDERAVRDKQKPTAAESSQAGPEPQVTDNQRIAALLKKLQAWSATINVQADEVVTQPLTFNDVAMQLELLENGQLRVAPLQLAVDEGTATVSLDLDASSWPLNGSVSGQLQSLDLDKIIRAYTDYEQSLGVLSGKLDLFVQEMDLQTGNNNIAVPLVGRLTINPSQLTYTDRANRTDIQASIVTEGLQRGGQTVRIQGNGQYLGEPFELKFTGDSLLDIRDTGNKYSLDLKVTAADTSAHVEGWIRNVFALQGMDLELSMEGPNPKRLYPLTGLPLPDLPPYQLSGDLSYQQNSRWRITSIDGSIGDSDIGGEIIIDLGAERPMLSADLYSELLDLDDFAGLLGSAPDSGPGETASPAQQREAEKESQTNTVLPAAPLDLERLQAMDASVFFSAKRVQVDKLPLDSLQLKMTLEQGHMEIMPLRFAVGEGTVRSTIEIEADDRPIQGKLATEIRHVNLKKIVQPFAIAENSVGIIGGRAKYWMRGDSIAEFLESADGGLYMLMTDGQLDGLLTELVEFDWGEALVALFAEQRSINIRCAFLNLHTKDGLVNIKHAIADTEDAIFAATGSVDLGQESLDIVFEPHPKDFSLFSTRAPLHVEGTFKNPNFYPGSAALGTKAAFAAVLTAVAGPIGTLLPFIEPGLTDDSNYCTGLIDSVSKFQ